MLDKIAYTVDSNNMVIKETVHREEVADVARELSVLTAQLDDFLSGEQVPDIVAAVDNYREQIAILTALTTGN